MSSGLAQLMLRHPQVRTNVEQFTARHVLPELNSQLPYMREIVCYSLQLEDSSARLILFFPKALHVLTSLEKAHMQWQTEAVRR